MFPEKLTIKFDPKRFRYYIVPPPLIAEYESEIFSSYYKRLEDAETAAETFAARFIRKLDIVFD